MCFFRAAVYVVCCCASEVVDCYPVTTDIARICTVPGPLLCQKEIVFLVKIKSCHGDLVMGNIAKGVRPF